jgi:cation diffusion facilitator CzcD-associated flavoprotein CzcO
MASWASGGRWSGRRDDVVVECGAQNNPRVTDIGDDHEVPLLDGRQRGAAALDHVQAAAASELVVHSGHIGLLPEVELAVTKLLLLVDERRQRERLLPVVFVWGFQVRNMDSSLALVFENDSKSDPWKNITENCKGNRVKPFPKWFWWLNCSTQIIGLTSLL